MGEAIIDQVVEDENGNVILVLRQTSPWESDQALENLQNRMNGYIDIVTHGALHQKYPDLRGKTVRIRLVCCLSPPTSLQPKFHRLKQTLAGLGIGFEIWQIDVADPSKREDPIKKGILSLFNRLRRHRSD